MEFNITCLAKQWLWFCFLQWIIRRHVSPPKQLLPYFERQLLPPWHLEATSPDLDDPTEPPAIVNVKVFVNIVNFVVNILDVVDDLYKDKSRFRTKLPCNCAHIRLRKKHIFNKGHNVHNVAGTSWRGRSPEQFSSQRLAPASASSFLKNRRHLTFDLTKLYFFFKINRDQCICFLCKHFGFQSSIVISKRT